MYKVFLLGLFLIIPSIFAQEGGGEEIPQEYWLDADTEDSTMNGSKDHPFKYTSQLNIQSDTEVKLWFYGATKD